MIWAIALIVCVLVICATIALVFWMRTKAVEEKEALDMQRIEGGLLKVANIESRLQTLELQRSTHERSFR